MDCVEASAWLESEDTGVSSNGLELRLLSDNNGGAACDRGISAEWERLSASARATMEPGTERTPTDEAVVGDEQEAHDIRFDAASSGDMTRD